MKLKDVSQQATYKKWKELVNMSSGELEKFLDSDLGQNAGLSRKEASEHKIGRGRDSARAILRMRETPVSEWNATDWSWAKRQISFVSRMSGNEGPLLDDKGRPTRKLLSLWVWGNIPNGIKPTKYITSQSED